MLTESTVLEAPAQNSPAATTPQSHALHEIVIERRPGWQSIDWKELFQYRDLLWFLTWRGIKVRYAQSAIGIGWAIIQPVFTMLVFTVIFSVIAGMDSEGVPYAVFSFAALVPWTYFSNALTEGTDSLVSNANMISKVYFPRVILPLSAVLGKLVDFAIAMSLLFVLMAVFRVAPNWGILMLPPLVLLMMLTAAGLGMWLTALAIQYRDIKHAMGFVVQLLMYAAPVAYPTSKIPENLQLLYAINPMVGVIEGFRSGLLGTRDMPWSFIAVGSVSAVILAVSGSIYFRSKEKLFADVA